MRTVIKNARIVTPCGVLDGLELSVLDGKIERIAERIGGADSVIDAEGGWLLPGFIDLHCHGGGGLELMDADTTEIGKIADFHLSHGTTTLYATTLASSDAELMGALFTLGEYFKNTPNGSVIGAHLEGPWLNAEQCGAQNPDSLRPYGKGELSALVARFPFIKRVSAAPEIEGGYDIADEARALGIVASVAHTSADFSKIERAISHGYTLVTHLYSGMRGVWRENSYRIAGAVEGALHFDELCVELIADGCHLPDELLRFVYKIKGADGICLVTDAIRAAGMPDGTRTKIGSLKTGLDVIVEDGVAKLPTRDSFAGSAATFDRLFRTMARAVGADMVELSRMASTTPARVMGLTDRGRIEVGLRADLVIMDAELKIKRVILRGELI